MRKVTERFSTEQQEFRWITNETYCSFVLLPECALRGPLGPSWIPVEPLARAYSVDMPNLRGQAQEVVPRLRGVLHMAEFS